MRRATPTPFLPRDGSCVWTAARPSSRSVSACCSSLRGSSAARALPTAAARCSSSYAASASPCASHTRPSWHAPVAAASEPPPSRLTSR
eukprot:6127242-Prymnesium_polylepis.1